jgi:predicted esterase
MPFERAIATETHGRYLIEPCDSGNLLVGFHGYAEVAEAELKRLQSIEGSRAWTVVSIQALHRFYRRQDNEVVASWMTRQDRDLAIQDNIAYALRVLDAVQRDHGAASKLVLSGFSQGVAMAYRTACSIAQPPAGVIALAGGVPPELDSPMLSRIPAVLIGRGVRDEWYTDDKLQADESRLREAAVSVLAVRFDGAHEWTEEFGNAARAFLSSCAT